MELFTSEEARLPGRQALGLGVQFANLQAILLNNLQRRSAKLAEKNRQIQELSARVKELSQGQARMRPIEARPARLESQQAAQHRTREVPKRGATASRPAVRQVA